MIAQRSATIVALQFMIALALAPLAARAADDSKPIALGPGPQLLIDDYLIAEQSFLRTTTVSPGT